jgi:hypothetical protein
VRNATLTLPDPQFTKGCGKGGNLTFVNGAATVGTATWKIAETTPVEGDLDGVPDRGTRRLARGAEHLCHL